MSGDHHPDRALATVEAFFAELAAHGVVDVVISPGSRSTPLALAADGVESITTHVVIDERSAAFFALGLGRAADAPAVLVCTSGTAAANYLPAVVEAHHGGHPLIVCTADRPPELRDRGSSQTIDQVGLYGSFTRWAVDLPVASTVDATEGSRVAARALAEANGPRPGPVHLNWPLREPLPPENWRPSASPSSGPATTLRREGIAVAPDAVADIAAVDRGLIVVGPGDLEGCGDAVAELARRRGWPVAAEAASSLRTGAHTAATPTVAHLDLLARTDWADDHVPDVVVRFGAAPTSKSLRLWLERHRPRLVLVGPGARFDQPGNVVTDVIVADPDTAARALGAGPTAADRTWEAEWLAADADAAAAVEASVDDDLLWGGSVVRALHAALPDGAALCVSNSLPVRDLDTYLPVGPRALSVFANRGAAGIDGVTSMAFGLSAHRSPTALLTGDVAFVHDFGGLLAGVRAGLDLTAVVVDNGGGSIFTMLPVVERIDDTTFDRLFRTAPTLDWAGLAAFTGLRLHQPATTAALTETLAGAVGRRGVDVVRVVVDEAADGLRRRGPADAMGSRR